MVRGFQKVVCIALAVGLLLVLSACSSWWKPESDRVRSAVVAYELAKAGSPIDDVVVRLSPGEFRADLGHGSRMVWLVSNALERRYREAEYFKFRDPDRSYLFVHEVRYDGAGTRALVKTVLYQVSQPAVSKELELVKTSSGWQISSETILDAP